MKKVFLTGMISLYPVPVVLVTCKKPDDKPNIITLAWAGVVCSSPLMAGISIQPPRYSYDIVESTGEFTINIPAASMVREVDLCGTKSGRDIDKFQLCGFTPLKGEKISAPLIKECPVNLECIVKESILLGSHKLFIGEVAARHIDEDKCDEKGRLIVEKLAPLSFIAPGYYAVSPQMLGYYGYSKQE